MGFTLFFSVRFGGKMDSREHRFFHYLRLASRLAMAAFFLMAAGWAQAAPSACTAMWGTNGTNMQYWTGTNWAVAGATGFTANAMGGYAGDGTLYYAQAVATPTNMQKGTFNNATGTITFTTGTGLGNIGVPSISLSYTTTANVRASMTLGGTLNLVGATFDRNTASRRMFLYATQAITAANLPTAAGPASNAAFIGLLDPETPGTVSWQQVTEINTSGLASTTTYPVLNNSGDIFADQQTGAFWIVTNTNPNRLLRLNLNYTGLTLNSAQVTATATMTGFTGTQAGIASDPLNGNVYVSFGAASTTTLLVNHTASPVVGSAASSVTGLGVSDSGNCVEQPDPPTVTKSINPTLSTATVGTGTLTITINNPNKVPFFLSKGLTDTFPANMSVYTTPGLRGTCTSDGAAATRPVSATITGAVGATQVVVAQGAMIPGGTTSGGSCSFSVVISATIANLYSNTIPAGSLTTTAGTNTSAATASYTIRATDFVMGKTQQAGAGTSSLTSSTVTVGAGRTYTYQLTIANSSSGVTATATFTDTIPALLTPLLTVTAVTTGGGACSIASVTVAVTRNLITGTFATAPPGSTCTVLVQGLVTTTVAASTNINNTAGLTTTFVDLTLTNNQATVTTTLSPATTLTIAKTNGTNTVAAGGTTSYTLTLVNLGPAAANNTTMTDSISSGLSCSSSNITCAGSGGAACTSGTATFATLQSGLAIPTLPASSTVNVVVTCNVTATGS